MCETNVNTALYCTDDKDKNNCNKNWQAELTFDKMFIFLSDADNHWGGCRVVQH